MTSDPRSRDDAPRDAPAACTDGTARAGGGACRAGDRPSAQGGGWLVSPPTSQLAWSWLALPYLAAAAALLAVLLVAAVVRGDRVIRIGLVSAAGSLLPWSLVTSTAICFSGDAAAATRLHQLGNGPTMLLGPSLALVLLAVSGQLERFRYLARIAIASGAALLVVAWSTPLVIEGVIAMPSGFSFPDAGPLEWLHALQVVAWPTAALVLALRAAPAAQRSRALRYLALLPILAVVSTADSLTAYGVGVSYPMAWLPALAGASLCLYLMLRTDLLRGRGLDRGASWELAAHAIAGGMIVVVVWVASLEGQLEPAVVALLTAPLWGAALLVTWLGPRGEDDGTGTSYEPVLERFSRELAAVDSSQVGERLGSLWAERVGLRQVTLELEVSTLDAETRAWLCSLGAPMTATEVALLRAGPLRTAIAGLFSARGAALIVPVVDRGDLIALAEARELAPRPLRDAERLFLFDSAQLVGASLIFANLARDAQTATAAAREVEIANALAGHYRPLAADDTGPWQLAIHHRPAAHPGGDGWSWALLSPTRLALLVVEAEASGVAGALVVAALQGAFAARSRDAEPSAADLLEALDDTAPGASRRALVLVLDEQDGSVTWANAGHRGAVLLGPDGEPELLGEGGQEHGRVPLPADALLLLLSPAVVGAPGLDAALRAGGGRGLRLVGELLELAAASTAPGGDLLAVGVARRAGR